MEARLPDKDNALLRPSSEMLDLRALEEIEKNPSISQRDLARNLGVALGFANACIKNMAHRGYIKLKKAQGNKFTYYITPSGIKAKIALTCRAFADTVSFYSGAKSHIRGFFERIRALGVLRLVFFGVDDLLDIIFIVAQDFDFEVLAVVEPGRKEQGAYMGRPLMPPEKLAELAPDLVVLSSLKHEKRMHATMKSLGLDIEAVTIFDMHWGGENDSKD